MPYSVMQSCQACTTGKSTSPLFYDKDYFFLEPVASIFESDDIGGNIRLISLLNGSDLDGPIILYRCAFCIDIAKKKSANARWPIKCGKSIVSCASEEKLI